LAHPGLALQQDRLAHAYRQEQGGGQGVVGEVAGGVEGAAQRGHVAGEAVRRPHPPYRPGSARNASRHPGAQKYQVRPACSALRLAGLASTVMPQTGSTAVATPPAAAPACAPEWECAWCSPAGGCAAGSDTSGAGGCATGPDTPAAGVWPAGSGAAVAG